MKSSIESMFEARANILKMEAEIRLLEAKEGRSKEKDEAFDLVYNYLMDGQRFYAIAMRALRGLYSR